MKTQQIKSSYIRLFGWILIISILLGTALSSCTRPNVIEQTPKFCWECETIHLANDYGYATTDTLCGMDESEIFKWEIKNTYIDSSVEHRVTCHQVGNYR
jgi:hypothetical protein